jgi:hypothetical protein
MRHNIEGGRGKCTPQDDTEVFNSVQDQHEINSVPTGISDVAIARRYDLELRQPAADDVQRGGHIVYRWVCGEDGGEKDPLSTMTKISK